MALAASHTGWTPRIAFVPLERGRPELSEVSIQTPSYRGVLANIHREEGVLDFKLSIVNSIVSLMKQ